MNERDDKFHRLLYTLTRVKGGTLLAKALLRFWTRCIIRRDLICRIHDGFLLHVSPESLIEIHLCFYGRFEADVHNFIADFLRPGHVFMDIGANIGCYSLLAAVKVESAGRVFSFEPVPHLLNRLKNNAELNRFSQIRLFNLACGRTSGTVTFFLGSGEGFSDAVGSLYASQWHGQTPRTCTVNVQALDEWCRKERPTRIDLMKIDVEGAEYDMLQGADATIQKFKPTILMEMCMHTAKAAGWEPHQILSWLEKRRYSVWRMDSTGITKLNLSDELPCLFTLLARPTESDQWHER